MISAWPSRPGRQSTDRRRPGRIGTGTGRRAPAGPSRATTASTDAAEQGSYTANQVGTAYGFPSLYKQGDLGSGQAVALYELQGFGSSDIATYRSCFKTSTSVTTVNVDGGPLCRLGGRRGRRRHRAGDEPGPRCPRPRLPGSQQRCRRLRHLQLDHHPGRGQGGLHVVGPVRAVHRAAPRPRPRARCSRRRPPRGSPSWPPPATRDPRTASANERLATTTQAVDDPASQPFVTGAGGTSWTALGSPPTESAWNDGPTCCWGAGGGGVSRLWADALLPGRTAAPPG